MYNVPDKIVKKWGGFNRMQIPKGFIEKPEIREMVEDVIR